jgi:hypothetical protein
MFTQIGRRLAVFLFVSDGVGTDWPQVIRLCILASVTFRYLQLIFPILLLLVIPLLFKPGRVLVL